jgi:hypothetical protein
VLLSGAFFYPAVDTDVVQRYVLWAHRLQAGHLPWASFHVEYPTGVLPFMLLPGGGTLYELQFVLLALAADAYLTTTLWRIRPGGAGAWLWILLPLVLGPIIWVRFDIFVAAALVGALSSMARARWRAAGVFLAAATLLKLWPLVLLLVLWPLLDPIGRRRMAASAAAVLGLFTIPVLAWGGASGLWWMLRYQGGHGLEFESVWAWPVVVAHSFNRHVAIVPSHATTEVPLSGIPGLAASALLPLALIAVTLYLWLGRGRRLDIATATLLVVAVVLLGSKIMSAQYVIWTAATVGVVLQTATNAGPRWRARLLLATAALAATTQWLFPFQVEQAFYGYTSGILAVTAHAEAAVLWFVVVLLFVIRPTTRPCVARKRTAG